MLARISSASLVQAKGRGCSFHESMKAPMALVSSLTEVKEPRRMASRVMTEKKHSARLSQEQLVGVKWSVMRGFFASQALTWGCLAGLGQIGLLSAVTDARFAPRISLALGLLVDADH